MVTVSEMQYLPVFIDIRSREVSVIGGGVTALRKVRLLLQAGADVQVVASSLCPELQTFVKSGTIRCNFKSFKKRMIRNSSLVIAASGDQKMNEKAAAAARKLRIPVNVPDNQALCGFIFPAIIDRDPVTIAVGSGGNAPVLSRLLREKLETLIPSTVSEAGKAAADFRDRIRKEIPDLQFRRMFWEQWFREHLNRPAAGADLKNLKSDLVKKLKSRVKPGMSGKKGEVMITGAGPGDPELLTIRALQAMQSADVIVHDGLVSEEVLNLARRDADRISVAKQAGHHSLPQSDINRLLISLASQGLKVCRLKGGDPFIFGRGGEECEALAESGISFSVIPAVSAASGCSAYSGIPLTHRDFAQTVQFVTGHCRKEGDEPDWASLAQQKQTIVVYMGLIRSEELSSRLIQNGRHPATPVAVIEKGTLPQQRVFTSTLGELHRTIEENRIQSPGLIIIGEVVSLRNKLQSACLASGVSTITELQSSRDCREYHYENVAP